MTVSELKEILEYYDDDIEVRFASQPNWPFEYSILDAVMVNVDEEDVIYLEEGQQLGYLNHKAKEELGW
jgi:hypothetical protein|tara:strand:- start:186 stop:392 length:207 start_codon:yes stop_codon:yes gene_type:complete